MARAEAPPGAEGDAETWSERDAGGFFSPGDPAGAGEVAAYEAEVEEARGELDRAIETAGMRRDPLRPLLLAVGGFFGLLPGFLRLINRPPAALLPHQEERLREDVRRVLSSEGRRLVLGGRTLRGAILALLPVLGFLAGWLARDAAPVGTVFGPLSKSAADLFRANDMERAAALCRDEAPQNGLAWCSMPMWRPGQGAPRG